MKTKCYKWIKFNEKFFRLKNCSIVCTILWMAMGMHLGVQASIERNENLSKHSITKEREMINKKNFSCFMETKRETMSRMVRSWKQKRTKNALRITLENATSWSLNVDIPDVWCFENYLGVCMTTFRQAMFSGKTFKHWLKDWQKHWVNVPSSEIYLIGDS